MLYPQNPGIIMKTPIKKNGLFTGFKSTMIGQSHISFYVLYPMISIDSIPLQGGAPQL